MKRALIVVDVQNDFCPGGSLAVPRGDEVVPIINWLVKSRHYTAVVATRDWHIEPEGHFADEPDFNDTWPVHCEAGTRGAEYHAELHDAGIDEHFLKGEYTASYTGFDGRTSSGERLADYLRRRGITHVDIVGLATDFCVKATALDAVRESFRTSVLLPACRGIAAPVGDPSAGSGHVSDTLTLALNEMREAGVTLVDKEAFSRL